MKAQTAVVALFVSLVAARPQGVQFPGGNDNGGCARGKALPGLEGKGTLCIGEFGENFGPPPGTAQQEPQSGGQRPASGSGTSTPSQKLPFRQPNDFCRDLFEECLGTVKFCQREQDPKACLDAREPAP
ncbi:hypothetical protein VFPPC_10666 [Pochonia chlamydosporia 170]|uniref:Uncharacterized protein n=1 Tax=Pochonia chlamydosporia 170 TaxID=1380566 RepID=A0A179F549_METCM|nr:hypothetical protein VFPPC_10666 [Pochonia chlamydosporia 170]OAQ60239.1 hypothetical protein VFPPC_10666 [Pochonia chlamydosporia 170]